MVLAKKSWTISIPFLLKILVFAALLAVIFTLVLSNKNSLEQWGAHLIPINKGHFVKQKAEALNSFEGIKSDKQYLEGAYNSLKSQVMSSGREQGAEFNSQQRWQVIAQDSLFFSRKMDALDSEFSKVEKLLHTSDFIQAKLLIYGLNRRYKKLRLDFSAAEQLYGAEQVVNKVRNNWLFIKQRDNLNDTDAVVKAEAHYQQAEQSLLQGEINQALNQYKASASLYQSINNELHKLVLARKNAQLAQGAWVKNRREYPVSSTKRQAQASQFYLSANQHEQAGAFQQAVIDYQKSGLLYQQSLATAQALVFIQKQVNEAKKQWVQRKFSYSVVATEYEESAEQAIEKAIELEQNEQLEKAVLYYRKAEQEWGRAYASVDSQVTAIDKNRQAGEVETVLLYTEEEKKRLISKQVKEKFKRYR